MHSDHDHYYFGELGSLPAEPSEAAGAEQRPGRWMRLFGRTCSRRGCTKSSEQRCRVEETVTLRERS